MGGEGAITAGGGGGGDAAAPDNTPPPETTSLPPEVGLASVAALGPVPAAAALVGVGTAIDRTATEEGAALQAEIPQPEVGAEEAGDTTAAASSHGMAEKTVDRPAAVASPASRPVQEPAPLPAPTPAPTEGIATPSVQAAQGGKADPDDARRVQEAVYQMPTQDPGLDVQAGPPPTVPLSGDADPALAKAQKAELDATIAAQREQGAADAAAPAGEHDIRVRRPREVLKPAAVAKPGAGGGGRGGAEVADSTAVIADEQQGAEVRAAALQAQDAMVTRRGEHRAKVEEEKSRSAQDIATLREENTAAQSVERQNAQAEVRQARSDWTAEQHQTVSTTNQKVQQAVHQGQEQVTQARTQGDREAEQHITAGEREASEHKVRAQADAARKKREAEQESDGVFGWLSSKVTAFFNALKRGLTVIFDAAKRLVRAAIDKAKKLAMAAIEAARKAIVSAIKAVGAALVALGDVLLAAFPGLRRRWRRFIEDRVRRAEAAVNRLADQLKAGITRLLDALAQGFEFLLNSFRKAMFAALDAAKAVALGAIKAAKAVADALGTFAVLARDIAQGPLSWLGKLGTSAKDGVRNHLWGALKGAVQSWFDGKLEEVLGLGGVVWGVLKRGGIGVKEVGTMAFEGLKGAIPAALIGLLIEKIVSMIIPAAGAVLAIIQGLQAAWGTVQRILGAIGKFVAFLKAVKSGSAGPQFAEMVAAAAVVVIDFVSNWLIKRLRGPAGKIGSKVRGIANRILARIRRTVGRVPRRAASRQRLQDRPRQKRQDRASANRDRLDQAVRAIGPALRQLLARGVSKTRLWALQQFWRLRHRLSALTVNTSGRGFTITAKVNPGAVVGSGLIYAGAELSVLIREIARKELLSHPEVAHRMGSPSGTHSVIDSPTAGVGHAMQMRTQLQQHAPINFGGIRRYDLWTAHTAIYQPFNMAAHGDDGVEILERRARIGHAGSAVDRVDIPGTTGAYPYLAHTVLPAMGKDPSMGSVNPGIELARFAQTGRFDAALPLDQRRTLGAMSHLIFKVESARSFGNFVLAPMVAQLTQQGTLQWQQALSPRTSPDLHLPMARANAPGAVRGLEAKIAEQTGIAPRVGGHASGRDVNAMAISEEQLIVAWVTQVAGGAVAAASEESIRLHVRSLVRDWYRLHSATRRL